MALVQSARKLLGLLRGRCPSLGGVQGFGNSPCQPVRASFPRRIAKPGKAPGYGSGLSSTRGCDKIRIAQRRSSPLQRCSRTASSSDWYSCVLIGPAASMGGVAGLQGQTCKGMRHQFSSPEAVPLQHARCKAAFRQQRRLQQVCAALTKVPASHKAASKAALEQLRSASVDGGNRECCPNLPHHIKLPEYMHRSAGLTRQQPKIAKQVVGATSRGSGPGTGRLQSALVAFEAQMVL